MCVFLDTLQKQEIVGRGAAGLCPLGGSRHLSFQFVRSPAVFSVVGPDRYHIIWRVY